MTRPTLVLLLLASTGLGGPTDLAGPQPAGAEPLVLRVSDAVGRPGAATTLVVRTYSPRAVGQGQLSLGSSRKTARAAARGSSDGPFEVIEEVQVFAREEDAAWSVELGPDGTGIDLSISSPSSSLNELDGPLFGIRVRLAADLTPGSRFTIALDPATVLRDPEGGTIPLELRTGELEVVAPDAPLLVESESDRAPPGGLAILGASTAEPFGLSAASLGFRFDPRIFAREPTVRIDPRYGRASLTTRRPEPDLLLVEVSSPDASWNRMVPGGVLELRGLVATDLAIGATAPVSLDSAWTEVRDAAGRIVPVELTVGGLEVIADEPLFLDGFETGDTAGWLTP